MMFPNAEKGVENTMLSGVVLMSFELFGIVMKHSLKQGCALRVPGCLRRLTFAFERPDNLISFI